VIGWDRTPESLVLPAGDPGDAAPGPRPAAANDVWATAPRLRSTVAGRTLDVALDNGDPFLDRYARPRMDELSPGLLAYFRRRLQGAWRILVEHHPEYAGPIAAGLRMIVPLAVPAPGQWTSATNITAFGAVAMSVPGEDVVLAETLVHEIQHLKLCALLDLIPLLSGDSDRRCYAPWRSDPRPAGGLLQGAYAYLGVARFWRRHRLVARGDQALRAQVEFARWRSQAPAAVETLLDSGRLTAPGQRFATVMREQLAEWQSDPVPPPAERTAGELSMHHRVRWQAQHVRPDPETVDRLAAKWAAGASPGTLAGTVEAVVGDGDRPGAAAQPESSPLAGMLALRYLDPARYRRWRQTGSMEVGPAGEPNLCSGDVALLRDDDRAAVSSYRRQIAAGQRHAEAWAGLALALHRTSSQVPATAAFLQRTGLLFALHHRLGAMTGRSVDPVDLAGWLAAAEGGRSP
jgi:hypothetical protein